MAEPSRRQTRASTRDAAGPSSRPTPPSPPHNPDDPSHPMSNHPDFKRDPRAAEFEQAMGFEMPWKFQFVNAAKLQNRAFEHTRWIDLATLEKFGVAEEFIELTTKIGITPAFWNHRVLAYHKLTIEFLSSLALMKENGEDIIVFRLANKSHKARLQDLGEVYGLERNCPIESQPWTRDLKPSMVWHDLAGRGSNRRSRLVHHPTLRILMRAYASQIFCRGETANITNDKELALMWQTLQVNPVKVNIIKLMIKFWIYQRDQVPKGSITMGGFVSLLAERMRLPLPSKSSCGGFSTYDAFRFKAAHFIDIRQTLEGDEYLWLREQGTDFTLPYPHKVNLANPDRWVIPLDYSHPLPRRHSMSDAPTRRSHSMREATTRRSHSPPPSIQHGDSSKMPKWAKKLSKMVGKLTKITKKVLKRQDEIGMQLSRLSNEQMQFGKKLDRVAEVAYDNDFFNRYGYWPGEEGTSYDMPMSSSSGTRHGPLPPPPPPQQTQSPMDFEVQQPAPSDPSFYPYLGNQDVMEPPQEMDDPFGIFSAYYHGDPSMGPRRSH